jgi:hypothetical protein
MIGVTTGVGITVSFLGVSLPPPPQAKIPKRMKLLNIVLNFSFFYL